MFRQYGLSYERRLDSAVDHLVSIELSGEPFGVVDGRWDLLNGNLTLITSLAK